MERKEEKNRIQSYLRLGAKVLAFILTKKPDRHCEEKWSENAPERVNCSTFSYTFPTFENPLNPLGERFQFKKKRGVGEKDQAG